MNTTAAHVLVVDDEADLRELIKGELIDQGYFVTTAGSGDEAIALFKSSEFDVVVTDVRMPGADGLAVLAAVHDISPDTEVIITTGYASLETAIKCLRGGAFDFVTKPFKLVDFLSTIAHALERKQLRAATALYQASHTIFATSEPERLLHRIIEIAQDAMGADDASLMLLDSSSQLYVAYSSGLPPEVYLNERAALGEGVAGRVALERKPALITGDVTQDVGFSGVASHSRARSSIVYPLTMGDRLLGVLNINRVKNTRPFLRTDLDRAGILASQALLALENMRLLRQAVASERLASIGQLAGSVAHEINSPLSFVMAASACLKERFQVIEPFLAQVRESKSEELRRAWQRAQGEAAMKDIEDALADAQEGGRRIRDIVKDLKGLVRTEDTSMPIDLNDVVRSSLRIAGADLRRHAAIKVDLGSEVGIIGNAGRLSQVFINLLVNAAHAISEKAPSEQNQISVCTRREGDSIIARVADTGPGIPPDKLPHIFEPFFTTKGSAGTGLGLAISRDILRQHRGEIRVESVLGRGATFTIVLPAATPPASTATKPAAQAGESAPDARKGTDLAA